MADNAEANAGTGGKVFATDQIGTVDWPFAKLAFGPRDTAHEVEDAAGKRLPVREATGGTATVSRVPTSTASATILAAAAGRLGAMIYNESTSTLRLKYGTTAAAADYTVAVPPDGLHVVHHTYAGRIDGILDAGSGNAQATEWT